MKQKVIVTFRLRESDLNKIKVIAEKNDRKHTELIRLIIENYIRQQYL